MDFTYQSYSDLLCTLKQHGYESRHIDGKVYESKSLYLRHDVDTDILGVLPLAEKEARGGYVSTWYFLFDASIYNLLSTETLSVIKQLVTMGHAVGLHVDATRYDTLEEMKTVMENVYALFNQMAGSNLLSRVFSFHRPASWLLESSIDIVGWINAYNPRYFGMSDDIVYVSDSNRREFWKEERLQHALDEKKNLTLLTHPSWWHDVALDSDDTYRFICQRVGHDRVGNYLRNTAKRYSAIPEEDEYARH